MLREPTLTKWWGTAGAPSIPRSVDSRPPWQVACRLRLRRDRGARERAQGARAGGQCAKDRATAPMEKNKPHHRRGSCSPAEGHDVSLTDSAQLAQKKKKRAGSELGRGFEVKSPIGRRSVFLISRYLGGKYHFWGFFGLWYAVVLVCVVFLVSWFSRRPRGRFPHDETMRSRALSRAAALGRGPRCSSLRFMACRPRPRPAWLHN